MTLSSTTSSSSRLRSSPIRSESFRRTILGSPRDTPLVCSAPSQTHCILTLDASEYDGSLRLRVEGLHFTASNIAFWIAKKTGFLPYEDAGLLDVTFGPKGISFDVTLENASEDDQETFFTVKNVAVSISDFDFRVRENDQWLATWFAKPVLKAFVKVSQFGI